MLAVKSKGATMKKYVSTLILFAAAIIWGLAFVAQKAASSIPAFTLIAYRSLIAFIALIPITAIFDKLSKNGRKLISFRNKKIDITKKELIGGAVSGIFLFAASALQQVGITDTDAGKTSFITAFYIVIVPIYTLILGKKPSFNAWVGIVIAIPGFYLLCIKEGFTIAPSDLLVVCCAFVFAMQIIAVDAFIPGCDGIRFSLAQFATVSVLSLVLALIFDSPIDLSTISSVLTELIFLGIGSSCIAYTCQIIGQKNSEPAVASIVLSLESVFGALFSALILTERMQAKEYLGCALVLLAVIISQLDFKQIAAKLKERKNINTVV